MSIASRFKESKIGVFWLKYEQKIILAIGIILVAAISFEAGYLHGQKNKDEPIAVNKAATAEAAGANSCPTQTQTNNPDNSSANSKSVSIENTATVDNQKCAFVASKNSNKYHLPTCRYAQNIKPENKICFSSADEAIARGFQGAKCCIK
jgi:hypothetical protein